MILKIKKADSVTIFNPKYWLETYINFSTQFKKTATSDLEKRYELMNKYRINIQTSLLFKKAIFFKKNCSYGNGKIKSQHK